ncbi:MAG: DUF1292 domain-containing protein [Oscillospiraceae bacterium]|nr:DUF1292 domain-containing protein [Oscillospiraceae bacterium]
MSEEYGPSFITLIDDEGQEIELEYIDALEYKGQVYMAFLPVIAEDEEINEEEYGTLILKSEMVNGEEMLVPIEDEEELNAVYELFEKDLFEEDEE